MGISFFLPVVGLCIGSFLNVVVYRLNKEGSPLKGRSQCPQCKHKLVWRDNIPLISFVWLHGECRYCHSPISWQYPLVELATAVLFFATGSLWLNSGGSFWQLFWWLWLGSTLLVIFVSDLRYFAIPDWVVFPTLALALIYLVVFSPTLLVNHLLAGLGGAGFFWFLVWLTKEKGMGWGDVKLAGLMGLILGWPGIGVALFVAFLTGAAAGVILVLLGKKKLKEEVPFGPFLAGATWVTFFWGDLLLKIYQKWLWG